MGLEIVDPMGQFLPPGSAIRTTGRGTLPPGATPTRPCATPGPAGVLASPVSAPYPAPGSGTPSGGQAAVFATIVGDGDFLRVALAEDAAGLPVLGFTLSPEVGDRLFAFTSQNLGRPMALAVDGVVLSSQTIRGAVSVEGQIEVPNGNPVAILDWLRGRSC